ncbi:MAG: 2Fe-2S iron-sulfur cluster-binding protein [Planctomycetota bacterium JB042]
MFTLRIDGREIAPRPDETVLDALLRAGVEAPHSCRAGACRACLVRATAGAPPEDATDGVPPPLRERGWFLACLARPASDLTLTYEDDGEASVAADVRSVELLAPDVARLALRPRGTFSYRPGQYVVLRREDGLSRPYSLASVPDEDDDLELHVRRVPGGAFSGFVFDDLRAGDRLDLRGPFGSCVYPEAPTDEALLLAGTGTGLAPLLGVLREALRRGHAGPIDLYHGGRTADDLYLDERLARLVGGRDGVRYVPAPLGGAPVRGGPVGPLDEVVFERHADLTGHRVFLCGAPDLVQKMRKQAFLRGAELDAIHADPFLSAPPR